MLIKPFGLCCKCSERKNCVVVTETNAIVLECPDVIRVVSAVKTRFEKSFNTVKKRNFQN